MVMDMKNDMEKNLIKIRAFLEAEDWTRTGIYEVLRQLEAKGFVTEMYTELLEAVKCGALYRWFLAYHGRIVSGYEGDPAFVEARILEHYVNYSLASPEKAEQLVAYIRVIGSSLTGATLKNLSPAQVPVTEVSEEVAEKTGDIQEEHGAVQKEVKAVQEEHGAVQNEAGDIQEEHEAVQKEAKAVQEADEKMHPKTEDVQEAAEDVQVKDEGKKRILLVCVAAAIVTAGILICRALKKNRKNRDVIGDRKEFWVIYHGTYKDT